MLDKRIKQRLGAAIKTKKFEQALGMIKFKDDAEAKSYVEHLQLDLKRFYAQMGVDAEYKALEKAIKKFNYFLVGVIYVCAIASIITVIYLVKHP